MRQISAGQDAKQLREMVFEKEIGARERRCRQETCQEVHKNYSEIITRLENPVRDLLEELQDLAVSQVNEKCA